MRTSEEARSSLANHRGIRSDLTLRAIKRWARARRFGEARLTQAYEASLHVAASRLLQSIFRENHSMRATLWQNDIGQWFLDLGREPMLRAPVTGPLPFKRLELNGTPWKVVAGRRRLLRSSGAFLNALRPCLEASELAPHFDRLVADFHNSIANLMLNRLIGQRLDGRAKAVEPVYEGHHYYPFPALRLGPSIRQVLECSNLNRHAIELTLVAARPCLFDSTEYADHRACFRAWAGIAPPRNADVVVPLHPWHLELSPVVRELMGRGLISVLNQRIAAIPLASQRTCRIVQTGFDIKLPVAVTLTGEDRLLYPLNRENATAFSSLARILLRASEEHIVDFQYDVASFAHADSLVGMHLAGIVRRRVSAHVGEIVVSALNLWCGPRQARTLLDLCRPDDAYEFFRAYCQVLMRGMVECYVEWGMAFEPHLQNVYVVLRGGMPVRIVLRDLDSTILDPVRIRPVARAHGVTLARGTWKHMPDFITGGRRLAHAMMYGHLGAVMSYISDIVPIEQDRLNTAVEETWDELIAQAPSPTYRRRVRKLREQAGTVGLVLWRRITRAEHVAFR